MSRLLVTAMLIGTGAVGFAAVSQAEMSLRAEQPGQLVSVERKDDGALPVPACRLEKTLKYDFNGNPYVKKVRVCA